MEQIALGILREWQCDRRIATYKAEARIGIHSLIDWSRAIVASLETWDAGHDYIAIHDLSTTGVSLKYLVMTGYNLRDPWLTTGSAATFQAWLKNHPERRAHLAVVVSSELSGQIATNRGRSSTPDHPQIESKIFDNFDNALNWAKTFIHTPV